MTKYARRAARQLTRDLSEAERIELMRTWLEDDPHRAAPYDVVVKPRYIHVWAIVGAFESYKGDLVAVSESYELPVDAVKAAIAYYARFPEIIEARIDANEGISYLESLS